MLSVAIKRYKNHQILIAKEVKAYIAKIKAENSQSDMDSDDLDLSQASLNSDRLEKDYQETLAKPEDQLAAPSSPVKFKDEIMKDMSVMAAQQKFIDRKNKFDAQFE